MYNLFEKLLDSKQKSQRILYSTQDPIEKTEKVIMSLALEHYGKIIFEKYQGISKLIISRRNVHFFDVIPYDRCYPYVMRNDDGLEMISYKTSLCETSPYYSCAKIFNHISNHIRILPITIFKRKFRSYLIEKCYYNFDELFNHNQ